MNTPENFTTAFAPRTLAVLLPQGSGKGSMYDLEIGPENCQEFGLVA
jgi:hypothetical protein